MRNLAAVILAAGKGTRMKSSLPKVLHQVSGRPMLWYPIRLLKELKAKKIIVVAGYGSDAVKKEFGPEKVRFVEQKEQLGTGHAVMCAMKELNGFNGDILILSGDVPLISNATVQTLFSLHRNGKRQNTALSLVTTLLDDPKGYGRIVRDDLNRVTRIVEDKDCSNIERSINEVNTGLYLVSSRFLAQNIRKLKNKNAQKEYYLPDLVSIAAGSGFGVSALAHHDVNEVMGVNNRVELARANKIMNQRILNALMIDGVTIKDPDNTYIDAGVKIGPDTVIYPGTHILGNSTIGSGCVIEQGVRIEDSSVADNSTIKSYSIIEYSSIGSNVTLGPFARLRPGTIVRDKARVGNFVEIKKSVIGKGSKANHLTYIGDAEVGENVNIGAGTITCNYDGFNKFKTIIEDNSFIGSDSQLVAPVKVGKGAYVGSGTTVTKDVPPDSLVVTRAPERVIKGWASKKRALSKKSGKERH